MNELFRHQPHAGRGSFSRSSSSTYRSADGVLREASAGVRRHRHYVYDENGILVPATRLEAARTNELHNSESPATQTRNLTAGTYTLWMEGSGSVDASGATDGSYGTATESTTNENDLTFTVSAQQDVTFTVNNSVDRFQCEEGAFRSSFIATQGSAVSRAMDGLTAPRGFGTQPTTIYAKMVERGTAYASGNTGVCVIGTRSGPNVEWRVYSASGSNGYRCQYFDQDGNINRFTKPAGNAPDFGDIVEVLVSIADDGTLRTAQSIDGGAVTDDTSGTGALGEYGGSTIRIGGLHPSGQRGYNPIISGPIIAPGVRTMDEMRSLAART